MFSVMSFEIPNRYMEEINFRFRTRTNVDRRTQVRTKIFKQWKTNNINKYINMLFDNFTIEYFENKCRDILSDTFRGYQCSSWTQKG